MHVESNVSRTVAPADEAIFWPTLDPLNSPICQAHSNGVVAAARRVLFITAVSEAAAVQFALAGVQHGHVPSGAL